VKGSFPTVTWITSEKCEPKLAQSKGAILGIKEEAVTGLMQLKGQILVLFIPR
jgi:hypothetical protein